jgi:hypothetical protein
MWMLSIRDSARQGDLALPSACSQHQFSLISHCRGPIEQSLGRLEGAWHFR